MQPFPSSCGMQDSLLATAQRMLLSEIDFLTVVDVKHHVTGTITYLDVNKALIENDPRKNELVVADVMKSEATIISCYEDEATALKQMRNNHSSHLPVVDEKNQLKGVVSFITVARRIIQLKHELSRDDEKLKVRGLGLSA